MKLLSEFIRQYYLQQLRKKNIEIIKLLLMNEKLDINILNNIQKHIYFNGIIPYFKQVSITSCSWNR